MTIETQDAGDSDSDVKHGVTGSTSGGPATGLFRSLTAFFATLVGLLQTRLELLTTELQEEVQRAAVLVVYAFVALLSATIGLFLAALAVVFAYWDTHRVLAASMMALLFFALTGIAVAILVVKARSQPRMLDATLAELKKDAQQLRARS